MCGRFALDSHETDLAGFFSAEANFPDWEPSFSIAPTDSIPIIRERASKDSGEVHRTVDAAIWDFHPAFIKDSKRPNFNARRETVATKACGRAPSHHRAASCRCAATSNGPSAI